MSRVVTWLATLWPLTLPAASNASTVIPYVVALARPETPYVVPPVTVPTESAVAVARDSPVVATLSVEADHATWTVVSSGGGSRSRPAGTLGAVPSRVFADAGSALQAGVAGGVGRSDPVLVRGGVVETGVREGRGP